MCGCTSLNKCQTLYCKFILEWYIGKPSVQYIVAEENRNCCLFPKLLQLLLIIFVHDGNIL